MLTRGACPNGSRERGGPEERYGVGGGMVERTQHRSELLRAKRRRLGDAECEAVRCVAGGCIQGVQDLAAMLDFSPAFLCFPLQLLLPQGWPSSPSACLP